MHQRGRIGKEWEGEVLHYTYIVRCADGTLYTGWTTDLARRIAAHNAGNGAKYTRTRRPVTLRPLRRRKRHCVGYMPSSNCRERKKCS